MPRWWSDDALAMDFIVEVAIMSANNGARATPEQMRRQHIFVVNGSAAFLDVVRELLQDEQYNVTTPTSSP